MEREHVGDRVDRALSGPLGHLPGPQVQHLATPVRQLSVGDVADDRLPEPGRAARVQVHEAVELGQDRVIEVDPVLVEELAPDEWVEAATQDGGVAQQQAGDGWQDIDLRRDQGLERVGKVVDVAAMTTETDAARRSTSGLPAACSTRRCTSSGRSGTA